MPVSPDSYAELTPCAALWPYVECLWSHAGQAQAQAALSHRVLPNGCLDIVFNFGDAPGPALRGRAAVDRMSRDFKPGRRR